VTSSSSAVYRGMDAATVESQYQPSMHVPSLAPFLEAYAARGVEARMQVPCRKVAFGDGPDEWYWYAPGADASAPLVVFVHGGYWRRLSGDDGCFLFPAAATAGFACVSVNYSLCPSAPLDVLVAQVRATVARLVAGVDGGHDGARVHVMGHSAGGHLAAMVALTEPAVAGYVFVSGVFDLEPTRFTTINDDVRLDAAMAARLSPLGAPTPVRPGVPTVVTWGAEETAEFARQSRRWARHWSAAPGNRAATVLAASGRNHFDVVFDLLDPATALGAAVVAQVGAPV